MFFKEIIGQEHIAQMFAKNVSHGKLAHALLLCGPQGSGKLPMAIALARYLCCEHRNMEDACGTCPSCIKMNRLVHPDVHFAFPVVKLKAGRDTVCNDFLPQWREMLMRNPYITPAEWAQMLDAGNRQPQIYVSESDEIQRKLSLKPSQGEWKVMIIWLPEKMNAECANKLLKLLEEPPVRTVFLLVSEEPAALLSTITSRTQRVNLPPISEETLSEWLKQKYMLSPTDADDIARRSAGSLTKAMENIRLGDEHRACFESFVNLMRMAWKRDIRELKAWSEQTAGQNKERQKTLLEYCQRMIRESFATNFRLPELIYMNTEERQFAVRFAPFINESNISGINNLLEEAQEHIAQNVNPKMIFFDLALRMIVLLKK